MSRRLKLPTKEMGDLQLYLIYQTGAEWEKEWAALQSHPIASLFTVVSKETMDAALLGSTSSLVKQLGLPPIGAIHKLPLINQVCSLRNECVSFTRHLCVPEHKKMPVCFQPDGVEGTEARQLAADVIRHWREKVYVIVVRDDVPVS